MMQLRTSVQWRKRYYREDRSFVDRCLARVPEQFATAIRRKYNQVFFDPTTPRDGDARRAANALVRTYRDRIKTTAGKLNLAASDDELCTQAKETAKQIQHFLSLYPPSTTPSKRLTRLEPLLNTFGVYANDTEELPSDAYCLPRIGKRGVTVESILLRCTYPSFWRRVFRCKARRKVEAEAIHLGLVNIKQGAYASNETVARCRAQRRRNRELLEALTAINELGECVTLQKAADASVSNPQVSRAELMTRIAGQERIARDLGHEPLFLTVTCPSRFHSCRKVGERDVVSNPKFCGASPRDAQRYLSSVYARVRAALHRRGIQPYGFRIAEPHHDGCPHWHLLLFVEPGHADTLLDIFADHFTREDSDELRAGISPRFKCVRIDWSRGSAAGYVAKYVAKNIDGVRNDGQSIGSTFDGFDAITAAERVRAWASVWGIRQFQQIGVAPVTLWRELRRIAANQELLESELIARAAAAADIGDWAEYIRVIGGTGLKLTDLPLGVHRATDLPNRYGELTGQRITGVVDRLQGDYVKSRIHEWVIEFSPSRERSEPWTRVNYCTPAQCAGTAHMQRPSFFDSAFDLSPPSQSVSTAPPNLSTQHISHSACRTPTGVAYA
ncbi:replication endonuclease [Jeongeupia chitinilytica]|uniref:Replication gene A protein-like domain-containing protein n=1 Tax=Jeongeupia chitinilytica TaxID=1041641 RepID=A0ABQ3H3E1_9NEIS|nr:replication endonuclease [Jeongeupia chitinilytica]GHD66094.1 hypothetical protein GCM10007350_27800 [Jeongeupia chitinilytica]